MTPRVPLSTTPFLALFVPANRPERLARAATSGADAVIVDLEDAVAEAEKADARAALVSVLSQTRFEVPILVRINGAATPHWQADMEALAGLAIDGIMLAKSESVADLGSTRSQAGTTAIIALIESAIGLANARDLARAADRLAFGSLDFAGDLGLAHQPDALLTARSELVLASRLAGIPAPIDGVTTAVRDSDAVRGDAQYAASLGFAGKLLIHPAQVGPALRGFSPDASSVDHARRMLAACGENAGQFEGRMVDAPVLAAAKARVAAADRISARIAELEGSK